MAATARSRRCGSARSSWSCSRSRSASASLRAFRGGKPLAERTVPAPMPELTAAAVRALYPVTAHETFLNHAAVGPISTRVIAAIEAQLQRHAADPFRQSELNAPIYREGRERAA